MSDDPLLDELRRATAAAERLAVARRALAASPDDPWWRLVAGRCLQEQGAVAEAAECATKILERLEQEPSGSTWQVEARRFALLVQAGERRREGDEPVARELEDEAAELAAEEDAGVGDTDPRDAVCGDWPGPALRRQAWLARIDAVPAAAAHALTDLGATAADAPSAPPLFAHVLEQRRLQAQDPPDERPVHSLAAAPRRFRRAGPEDLARVRARVEEACGGVLARSEMTRTYLADADGWRIHEGDLVCPDGLICSDLRLVVTGDFVCEALIDSDGAVLVVLGDLRCQEIYSEHGLCVLGDVVAGRTIYQFYNDWAFEALGTVSARAFVSADKMTSFDRDRARIEYYHHGHESGGALPDALSWLGLDERDSSRHVEVLRRAYAGGRDPLPAPPGLSARIEQLGPHAAWQRQIAEGRAEEEALALRLADPGWCWEVASLLPPRAWTARLRQQA